MPQDGRQADRLVEGGAGEGGGGGGGDSSPCLDCAGATVCWLLLLHRASGGGSRLPHVSQRVSS